MDPDSDDEHPHQWGMTQGVEEPGATQGMESQEGCEIPMVFGNSHIKCGHCGKMSKASFIKHHWAECHEHAMFKGWESLAEKVAKNTAKHKVKVNSWHKSLEAKIGRKMHEFQAAFKKNNPPLWEDTGGNFLEVPVEHPFFWDRAQLQQENFHPEVIALIVQRMKSSHVKARVNMRKKVWMAIVLNQLGSQGFHPDKMQLIAGFSVSVAEYFMKWFNDFKEQMHAAMHDHEDIWYNGQDCPPKEI